MTRHYLIENDELMKEWNWEANEGLNPNELTFGSNKKAWWKCSTCQGKWQATICDRTRIDGKKTNCPYCAGQKVLTGYNDLATRYPEILEQWHLSKNILKPTEVMPGSSKKIWWVCPKGHEYEQSINARILHPNSCPFCSGQKVVEGINDLQSKYPNVAKEWDYEKNYPLKPEEFLPGSGKKVWWKCSKCGNEWQVEVRQRVKGLSKCPNCKKQNVSKNNLQTDFDF